MNVRENTNGV